MQLDRPNPSGGPLTLPGQNLIYQANTIDIRIDIYEQPASDMEPAGELSLCSRLYFGFMQPASELFEKIKKHKGFFVDHRDEDRIILSPVDGTAGLYCQFVSINLHGLAYVWEDHLKPEGVLECSDSCECEEDDDDEEEATA